MACLSRHRSSNAPRSFVSHGIFSKLEPSKPSVTKQRPKPKHDSAIRARDDQRLSDRVGLHSRDDGTAPSIRQTAPADPGARKALDLPCHRGIRSDQAGFDSTDRSALGRRAPAIDRPLMSTWPGGVRGNRNRNQGLGTPRYPLFCPERQRANHARSNEHASGGLRSPPMRSC